MNIDRLISQHERMKDAACGLDDAATDFARNCNGNNGHIIPAPTQYEILGNLKVAVWGIREVVEFLPAGLANALANPDTVTTDRDVLTGEQRDPAESQRIHADALRVAKQSLNTLCEALKKAQTALNSQGFEEATSADRASTTQSSSELPLSPWLDETA